MELLSKKVKKLQIIAKAKDKDKDRDRDRNRGKGNKKIKGKKKLKKKKEDNRFRNKIIRPGEMELYACYKTGQKNFPEGREQFAFNYNISEIILFGGIVTNKSNNVWVLDPCKIDKIKKNYEEKKNN